MPNFPHHTQLDQMDCGPTCLRMVARHYGRQFTAQSLRERAQIGKEGVSLLGISEAAESIGFRTVGVKIPLGSGQKPEPFGAAYPGHGGDQAGPSRAAHELWIACRCGYYAFITGRVALIVAHRLTDRPDRRSRL